MGLYAEPQGDKLEWIQQFPEMEQGFIQSPFANQAVLPVVCLQQGFTALGVAYNDREYKRFRQGRSDGRWYLVPKVELRKVVPGGEKMKELR
jgi:hypothetical protein